MKRAPDCTCVPYFERCRACSQRAGDERLAYLESEARRHARLTEYYRNLIDEKKPQ